MIKLSNKNIIINKRTEKLGFTLVETIIYVALVGLVISSFIIFVISISNSREKVYVVQEVNNNGRLALNILSQKIKLADSIISPLLNSPGDYLALDMDDQPNLFFGITNGVLGMAEGNNATTTITTDDVRVTALTFSKLTSGSTKDNIKIEITIEYKNSASVNYTYSNTWQTAVSVRQ